MMTPRVGSTLLATVVALAALSGVAQAVPVVYTIDITQSSVTSSGTLVGVPLVSQVDSSNTTALQGTLSADLAAGLLTFSGGSAIDAVANVNPITPLGVGEQNIGLFGATAGIIGQNINISANDLSLDIPAGTATNGAVPVGMTIKTATGTGYSDFAALATFSLTRAGDLNITPNLVSLTNNGLIETLVLPFRTSVTNTSIGGTVTVTTGVIVATRPIPEPSTFVLAGLGIAGMALVAWRKRHAI